MDGGYQTKNKDEDRYKERVEIKIREEEANTEEDTKDKDKDKRPIWRIPNQRSHSNKRSFVEHSKYIWDKELF